MAEADTPQTQAQDTTSAKEPTPQERAHQALFDKSGASPEQIQVIQDWHRLLTKVTDGPTGGNVRYRPILSISLSCK